MEKDEDRTTRRVFREYAEAAAEMGATVETLDDDFGFLVRLHWQGRFVNLCGESLPINPAAAAGIARDKWYTLKILRSSGIRVPEGRVFFRAGYYRKRDFSATRGKQDALGYAAGMGYPVVVKPNSGSRGRGVALVHDEREFSEALHDVFNLDHIALVQQPVPGDDIRIIMLDGELLLAYRRKMLSVEGDGTKSVGALVDELNVSLRTRDHCKVDLQDHEIARELKRQNFDSDSVPGKGQCIVLKTFNLNLAFGAEAEDISGEVNPAWVTLCRRICHELNIRYAGIDLKCHGRRPDEPVVLEVNSRPSLKHWYLSGHRQQVVDINKTLIKRIFDLVP